ncbi:MAG: hypothetical protein V4622_14140 [Bacteroidota bacterium]
MDLIEIKNKAILYAVLDWGFGHVTRSIGIIRELLEQENQVIIACNKEQKALFKSYFPNLRYEFLNGYNFQFSGKGNWSWDLWKQRKSFFKTIKSENNFVDSFIQENKIDLIISDHRYGLYSSKVPSIFVTHQLHLPISSLYFFIQNWHEKQIRKFSSVWVLDDEKSSLAGKLSKKIKHQNLNYVGIKSRFEKNKFEQKIYDFLLVISGPKPYSEQFLVEVLNEIDFKDKKVAVLHPNSIEIHLKMENFDYFPANSLKENDKLFYQSEKIISRSGYSTLMDLQILNKKAILIPTKGQKEQEYLSRIWVE